jgi:glycine dehydrogenase subunit 2
MQNRRDYSTRLRRFHEAKWDEEIIYELSVPGQRGVLPPKADPQVESKVGDGISALPSHMIRKKAPFLPEVHQMRVNRHYMRLSQEVLGADITPDISQGTCTMKYSPKVQEHLVSRDPHVVEVHPLQDSSTIQGMLEIYYKTEQFMKEISGMDAFSFHSGGGANACFGAASVVRAFHESRGDTQRDEVITTMFSHPCDAGAPATAGYKIITLMPDENGYSDLEALKSVLSERTAAIFVTNPEDTGIFNPRIKEYVNAAHEVGALCYYDQANVNGIMGITRAKEAGFDVIHYNLHKTFSSPHGGMGPGCGALGVKEELKRYLPVPRVDFDGSQYHLDYNCPDSIGRLRSFYGNIHIIIRAYMWIMQMGGDGIRESAVCSVLNNQYLMKKVAEIPGVSLWYDKGKRRLEQCRYSWEKLKEDTGFGTEDVTKRLIDFGMEHYWMSHHPWIVPEPFTLEPCESYSKDDLDEYVAVLKQISKECYKTPEIVKKAPHNAPIHNIETYYIDNHESIAATWRQWLKRKGQPIE